jgi:acyl CoA:acetate/3-ketoacid CoA transferase beta subunit
LITDLGVFEIDAKAPSMRLTALATGVSLDEITAKTEAEFTLGL